MPLRSRWALPGLGVVSRRASMAARCVEDTRKLGRAEGLRATQPVALCPGSLCPTRRPWCRSSRQGTLSLRGRAQSTNTLCSGAAKAPRPGAL